MWKAGAILEAQEEEPCNALGHGDIDGGVRRREVAVAVQAVVGVVQCCGGAYYGTSTCPVSVRTCYLGV